MTCKRSTTPALKGNGGRWQGNLRLSAPLEQVEKRKHGTRGGRARSPGGSTRVERCTVRTASVRGLGGSAAGRSARSPLHAVRVSSTVGR